MSDLGAWRGIWRDQINDGLLLRRRIVELESEIELLEQALARQRQQLSVVRHDYELSSGMAREMFETFKRELEDVPVAEPSTPPSTEEAE